MEYYVELLCDRTFSSIFSEKPKQELFCKLKKCFNILEFQMSEETRVNLQNEFINMMNNVS